jgi:hypothetical protein
VVLGVVAVAAVIAAESFYPIPLGHMFATAVVVLILYWLVHAYAWVVGERFDRGEHWSRTEVRSALRLERSVIQGGLVPIGALAVAWLCGASSSTAGLVALWTSAVAIVLFELAAGLRQHLRTMQLVGQTLIGALFGATLLGLRSLVG